MIAAKQARDVLLADAASPDAAMARLQGLLDERYQGDAAGGWDVVAPNGLTRLGMTAAQDGIAWPAC